MKIKSLKRNNIKQNKKTKKVYRGGESLINKKDRKNALISLCTQILDRKKGRENNNCILVHFLTDYTGSIYKYPTIPKSTIPKSLTQTVDTVKRKTVGNNLLSRHIVIITELRNINNTQEEIYKDDIYHYILTFDIKDLQHKSNNDTTDYLEFADIIRFFNTFKETYDETDNDEIKDETDNDEIKVVVPNNKIFENVPDNMIFENAFVTKKLSFCDIYDNKNKFFSNIPIIKIINLTKCDFKEQKFVDPLSNNNKSNNYNDVDLIIKNQYYSGDQYTSTLFMKSIYNSIRHDNSTIIVKDTSKIDKKPSIKNEDMLNSAINVCKESNHLRTMFKYKYTLSYSYDFIRSKELIDKNVKVDDDNKYKYINFIVNIDQPKIPEYIKPKISERFDEYVKLESIIKKINKEWKKTVCLSMI